MFSKIPQLIPKLVSTSVPTGDQRHSRDQILNSGEETFSSAL